MNIILAQVTGSDASAPLWVTGSVLVLGSVSKFIKDWHTDKVKQRTLGSIDASNKEMRDNLATLNAHLQKQEAVRDAQHQANLREMDTLCKAQYLECKFKQQKNQ